LPRVVNENAAHQRRGHGEEMRAILPLHAIELDDPQVGFVDERGRLQGVAGPFALQIAMRDPAQLVVDERDDFVSRGAVLAAPTPRAAGKYSGRRACAPIL
jgi:hypothetical protein